MSRRLRELEQLRDNLLHMIIHEVRSQIDAISVSLELVKELSPDLGADAWRMIKTAHDCARKVFQMITQLVDIGRFEANQMPLKREKTDLVKTAKAAIESLSATFSGWSPALEAPKALEAICDPEMIRRVIENLLANALKFTPPAQEVKLIISRHGADARVGVVDQGPGIPPDLRQRIFETFSHSDALSKRYGAGPGLAYSKLAVEAHGGKIGVESRPGYGSMFWFTVPLG
jgi:signal transduction histidine kinase